jgi:hypothetical protein
MIEYTAITNEIAPIGHKLKRKIFKSAKVGVALYASV